MAPELQVLTINAVCLAVGYLGIFPRVVPLTLGRLAWADLGVGLTALGTSAALFWGAGAEFWLLGARVTWPVFAVVTLVAIEAPVFWWFARRHGIDLGGDG